MARSLRPIEIFPITTRELDVLRVADVTPGMRRVTLGGTGLKAHSAPNGMPVAAFRSDGFDDEFKIYLQHPDAEAPVVPQQMEGVLHWPRENPHLLFRTYTVRRWDAEAGELDVDFVVHGVGPATSWARHVQPGETLNIAGPKSSALHPEGVAWTLVAGDETALPAIGRWLETWPAGARGQVFIEIADAAHQQDLPTPPGVELTWLSREGAEPGTTTLLLDALKAAPWWEGVAFAWIAGETNTLTPIRRWLRNERGLPKEQVEVTGYWRKGAVVVEEGAEVQDLDATEDAAHELHELVELMPSMAVRVAVTIGLPVALGADAKSIADVATACHADSTGVAKLLRYLAAINVTQQLADGRYQLTEMGRLLDNDDVIRELSLDGYPAQQELAGVLSLLSAVRTGAGDQERPGGTSFEDRVQGDAALLADRVDLEAEMASYVTGALASNPMLGMIKTMTVAGFAAGSFARALVAANPQARASVLAAPSELAAMRELGGEHERIEWVPGSVLSGVPGPVNAVLLVDLLRAYSDIDAAHVLQQAAKSLTPEGFLLVFAQPLFPERADDHDLEHDLVDFALSGGGSRTIDEYLALFERAGLPAPLRFPVGWGRAMFVGVRGEAPADVPS